MSGDGKRNASRATAPILDSTNLHKETQCGVIQLCVFSCTTWHLAFTRRLALVCWGERRARQRLDVSSSASLERLQVRDDLPYLLVGQL